MLVMNVLKIRNDITLFRQKYCNKLNWINISFSLCLVPIIALTSCAEEVSAPSVRNLEYVSNSPGSSYDIKLESAQWVQMEFPDAPIDEELKFSLTVNQSTSNPWHGLRIGSAAPDNNIQSANAKQSLIIHWSHGLSGVLDDPYNEVTNHSDGDVIVSGSNLIVDADRLVSNSRWAVVLDFSCILGQIKIKYLSSHLIPDSPVGIRAVAFKPLTEGETDISLSTETIVDSKSNTINYVTKSGFGQTLPDADSDGIPDAIEGTYDADLDGVPNFLDLDSDNDSILDYFEGASDSDGDGVHNFVDLDSDNDGVFDLAERYSGSLEGQFLDTDGDGMVNVWHNVGKNGLVDLLETEPDSGVPLDDEEFGDYGANACDPILEDPPTGGTATGGTATSGTATGGTATGGTATGGTATSGTATGGTATSEQVVLQQVVLQQVVLQQVVPMAVVQT